MGATEADKAQAKEASEVWVNDIRAYMFREPDGTGDANMERRHQNFYDVLRWKNYTDTISAQAKGDTAMLAGIVILMVVARALRCAPETALLIGGIVLALRIGLMWLAIIVLNAMDRHRMRLFERFAAAEGWQLVEVDEDGKVPEVGTVGAAPPICPLPIVEPPDPRVDAALDELRRSFDDDP